MPVYANDIGSSDSELEIKSLVKWSEKSQMNINFKKETIKL